MSTLWQLLTVYLPPTSWKLPRTFHLSSFVYKKFLIVFFHIGLVVFFSACPVSGAAPDESNSTEESDTILRLRPARVCVDQLQTLHLDAASGNGSFYLHDV
jgi:hypothetical protein